MSVPPSGERTAPPRSALSALAVAVAVLVVLGAGVLTGFGPQQRLDAAVSRAFYAGDRRPGWVEALLQVVTAPGLSLVRIVVFVPVVVWLLRRRAWWTTAWVLVAVLLVGPLTSLLKVGFDRVRPQFAQGGAQLSSLSYPSGHSSGIATLVTVGLVLAWPLLAAGTRRWVLPVGIALVLLVGLSRMWLGVHYLTDVVGGWSLGIAWSLGVALVCGGLPGGRAALVRHPGGGGAVTGLEQSVVLTADDGSLGPLLRIADDRLPPGGGYGGHEHRAVDVVAVVLAGSLRHEWGTGARLRAGDVGVLRAGSGLAHDEVAGEDGARVLQAYLRGADPAAPASHTVHAAARGWVDLGRPDARLWVGQPGEDGEPPEGLRVEVGGALLVWQLDAGRPAWAEG